MIGKAHPVISSSLVEWWLVGHHRNSIVALSSCEAEYIAPTITTYQAVWMNRLIS